MALNRKKLFALTRSTSFLWQSSLGVGLFVIALGTGISFLNTARPPDPGQRPIDSVEVVSNINNTILDLLNGKRPFGDKLMELHQVVSISAGLDGLLFPDASELPALSSDEYRVASAYFHASEGLAEDLGIWEPTEESKNSLQVLQDLAGGAQPVPFANYALGMVYEEEADSDAADAYLREIELFNRDAARKRLVRFYLARKQYDAIKQLETDPAFRPHISPAVRQIVALANMDWPALFKNVIPAAYEYTRPTMAALAIFSGLIWAIILLRFNGTLSVKSAPMRLALPALVLGALSAHATVLFIFWQEHQLHLGEPPDTVGQFIYCLSIGLREEGLKLLFFCPLIPLLWRRSSLEILTVAGLVGLGFAMEENIGYFQRSAGLSVLGRFVTANFLHISLTAMGGLTLARACIHKGEAIQEAAITFATIVAVHGLYDAFIIVPLIEDLSWLSLTVFIVLGYQYFGWLRYLRDDWRDPVSITSVFTLGVVLLTGLSYTLHAWDVGASLAFQNVAGEVIGIGIILILFYREIPETLDYNGYGS